MRDDILIVPCSTSSDMFHLVVVMKASLIVGFALGLLVPYANAFVTGGGYALERCAHSRGVASTTALAHPIPSRRSVSTLRAVGARGRRLDGPVMSTTVIPADFNLPIGIGALGLALSGSGNLGGGFVLTALGLGLAFQATRVSIEFDDDAMEVKVGSENGELVSSGENAFVGGQSRWSYNTWTNWEVYPSENLPILLYFKETQTKPEGQIHFFPFIMKSDMLLNEVRARVPQVAK